MDQLDLAAYAPFHITRADLLARLGRHAEAADAFRAALDLTDNQTECRYLEHRLASLPNRSGDRADPRFG